MYNQALVLMRCVVAAEEYDMARHPLPPIPASGQDARDFLPWAGAQRSSSDRLRLEVPKPTTRESAGP